MLFKKIFYLLLLFSAFGYAQQKGSLSGKVIDKTTGEPLVNAEVIIKETGKGTASYAAGGADGNPHGFNQYILYAAHGTPHIG